MRNVWDEHPGYIGAYVVNLLTALYLGGTAVLMPSRFLALNYDALRDSLGIATWGAILVGYGAALLAATVLRVSLLKVVLLAGAFMYLLIGIWFAIGLRDPNASPWGAGIFIAFGVWAVTQWNAYRYAEAQIIARDQRDQRDQRDDG